MSNTELPPDDFAARVLEASMQVSSKKKKTKWGGDDNQHYITSVLLALRLIRVPGRENFFVNKVDKRDPRVSEGYLCAICRALVSPENRIDHLDLHWKQVRFVLFQGAENPGWEHTEPMREGTHE